MRTGVHLALAAAFSNAVSLMTQHSASTGTPKAEKGWRLVVCLVPAAGVAARRCR
jgi:hypothetical protein